MSAIRPNGGACSFASTAWTVFVPCDNDHLNVEGCDYSMVRAATAQNSVSAPRPPAANQLTKDSSHLGPRWRNLLKQRDQRPSQRTARRCCSSRPCRVLVGIFFEERYLVVAHGEAYRNYREEVPMLIPVLKRLKKSESRGVSAPVNRD